jgi:hypothetical protein
MEEALVTPLFLLEHGWHGSGGNHQQCRVILIKYIYFFRK